MTAPNPNPAPTTHRVRLTFGHHKGELITRVPARYLKFMVCNGTDQALLAAAELERRGHVMPDIEIAGHAIDRASLKCRKHWHQTRAPNEGLHAWLVRVAQEALKNVTVDKARRYHHLGLIFVFDQDGRWPVLVTVMPERRRRVHEGRDESEETETDG